MGDFRKAAIVGTAPSWALTPWQDADMLITSLNDAYNMPGFQRADEWYDIHPVDKFWMTPPPQDGQQVVIMSHQVPFGHYVRPYGHLDWLATQPFTKWLHPDHAKQLPASATWPHAQAFPKAEIEAAYGHYCTSSPQWIMAHLLLRGYREIHIYGIHLSTESEYIDQRPGFEYLIGGLLGPGKRTMSVKNGLRRYESQDGVVVLPEASPVLSAQFQYGFQPSPRRVLEPMRWELHKAEMKRNRMIDALKTAWGPIARFDEPIPNDPENKMRHRVCLTSTVQQELFYYDALVADWQEQIGRAHAGV
jgi:hypothetical protein